MRASVILAALPLALFATVGVVSVGPVPAPPASSLVTKAITSEAALAFDARWPVKGQMLPVTNNVRVETIRNEVTTAPPVPQSEPVASSVVRTAVQRKNICTRHGMRKVKHGKRWRCRR